MTSSIMTNSRRTSSRMAAEYVERKRQAITDPDNYANYSPRIGDLVMYTGKVSHLSTLGVGNVYQVTNVKSYDGTNKERVQLKLMSGTKFWYGRHHFLLISANQFTAQKEVNMQTMEKVKLTKGTQVVFNQNYSAENIRKGTFGVSMGKTDKEKYASNNRMYVLKADGEIVSCYSSRVDIVETPKNGEIYTVKIVNPDGGCFLSHTKYRGKVSNLVGKKHNGTWALHFDEDLSFNLWEFVITEINLPKPLNTSDDIVVSIKINSKTITGKSKYDGYIVRVVGSNTDRAGKLVYSVAAVSGLNYKYSVSNYYYYPEELVPVKGIIQDPYFVKPDQKFKIDQMVVVLNKSTVIHRRELIGRAARVTKIEWDKSYEQWFVYTSLSGGVSYEESELELIKPIKIGSIVKVVSRGKTYKTMVAWITRYAPEYLKAWEFQPSGILNNYCGKIEVVALGKHPTSDKIVALISNGSSCSIIGVSGLKVV